jgi:hypothetical protein
VIAEHPRSVLRDIGFQHVGGVSRVFVRTSAPPRYTIADDGSTIVVLLHGARAARANDLRPLDTSFFPSVVHRVVPKAAAAGTRVEIHLRRPAPHRVETDGDALTIVFEAPAGGPGARR